MKLTQGVKNLLIANILVFFLSLIVSSSVLKEFVLFPFDSNNFNFFQLFSYMFLHVSFTHILLNMMGLIVFGSELENKFGTKNLLSLYFISGVFGGLTHLLFSSSPVVGASGAIWGLMASYAVLYPNRKLYLYFLFPVKSKYIIGAFFLIELFLLSSNDGTSHLAHIGGALSGCIFYLLSLKSND